MFSWIFGTKLCVQLYLEHCKRRSQGLISSWLLLHDVFTLRFLIGNFQSRFTFSTRISGGRSSPFALHHSCHSDVSHNQRYESTRAHRVPTLSRPAASDLRLPIRLYFTSTYSEKDKVNKLSLTLASVLREEAQKQKTKFIFTIFTSRVFINYPFADDKLVSSFTRYNEIKYNGNVFSVITLRLASIFLREQ